MVGNFCSSRRRLGKQSSTSISLTAQTGKGVQWPASQRVTCDNNSGGSAADHLIRRFIDSYERQGT